jgi:Chaperone of endosialidase
MGRGPTPAGSFALLRPKIIKSITERKDHIMKSLAQFKLITLLLVILLAIVCFASRTEALDPPPDGGYPGGNTAEGQEALASLTSGDFNTAVGFFSLVTTDTNDFNTGIGAGALFANTADNNTATGAAALLSNNSGSNNTANGSFSLSNNLTGNSNTAVGHDALYSNIVGSNNTAIGAAALFANTADNNTATGAGALMRNTSGFGNTANGWSALSNNTIGNNNTAIGVGTLFADMAGSGNTAIGRDALSSNATGNNNTAVGEQALFSNTTGEGNVAIGREALSNSVTGVSNLALGINAGGQIITANNVIAIGHPGANLSGTTWIGNVFGVTTQSGTTSPVVVSDGGQLGTVASSERFKKDIATMEKASEAILALRPVTFHYKSDLNETPQFGLIAEEVAKVNPALVLLDKEGKPFTVRYDAVNAMLLNEFLKDHSKVEQQDHKLQEQGAIIARQQKQIEALTAGLQKVSARLDLTKQERQTVLNNH